MADPNDSDGPGITFHAPLTNSVPKLKPSGPAKYCARCGKKFSFLRPKNNCRNCGNVVCGRCSENKVELIKFGHFSPVRVCDLCCQVLRISSMSRDELRDLQIKILREFIQAFDLPSNNIIEKDDLVDVIYQHRPMPDRNEIFFRENMPIAEPATPNEPTSSTGDVPDENTAGQSNGNHTRRPNRPSNLPQNNTSSGPGRTPNTNSNGRTNFVPQRRAEQSQREPQQHPPHTTSTASSTLFNQRTVEGVLEQLLSPFSNAQAQTQTSSSSSREPIPPQNNQSNSNSFTNMPPSPPYRPEVNTFQRTTQSTNNFRSYDASPPPPQMPQIRQNGGRQSNRMPSNRYPHQSSAHRPTTAPSNSSANSRTSIPVATTSTRSGRDTNRSVVPSVESIIKNRTDISKLSVKDLKEILAKNCVDFSGTVEKSELIAKVNRLVENSKKEMATDVDTLSHDDLCKVCLDASQNCLIMKCGHMSTCMDCGKKLQKLTNECPICREAITELIRVYRA